MQNNENKDKIYVGKFCMYGQGGVSGTGDAHESMQMVDGMGQSAHLCQVKDKLIPRLARKEDLPCYLLNFF